MESKGGQSDTKLLLVTANVGSLFEDPQRLLPIWLEEFISNVTRVNPRFLALHLQEVGGKTYENSMGNVQEFIRCLCDAMAKTDFIYVHIYMDEDFKSAEHFTALGNIYFGHKDICILRIWNFLTHDWDDKLDKGKQIYSGNIENVPTKEKAKFPQHFFPECKWSRKGFMRTRWEINGTAVDLVNIHLFHDASNLAACEDFPSVYCKTRRRALIHTIERFHLDEKNGSVPFFIFGDFNFRCDTAGVVKELTANLTVHRVHSVKNENTKINYRNSDGNNILTVGRKEFCHADHQLKFKELWLKEFDRELEPLTEILVEYPISFIPSYPFEEDPEMPTDYMSTRCPSWCDRILMAPQVKDIIKSDEWKYDMIGQTVCMGDHKPIYLTVRLKPNKGTYKSCDCSCSAVHIKNNNNLTSPVKVKTCPYVKKVYNQVLKEGKILSQDSNSQDLPLADGHYTNTPSRHDKQIIETPLKVGGDKDIKKTASNYSSISINIINSEDIYVCMCTQTYNSGSRGDDLDSQPKSAICPICRNITKGQPVEHRYRLLSNSVVLSENIIVNRIDTKRLNTYIERSHVDPYTPESNESSSPYPELRSIPTSSPSYSCEFELFLQTTDEDNKKTYPGQNGNDDDLYSLQSVHAITEKQSRATVTPVQLKSRLEDLQRTVMRTSDRDDVVGKGDVNNVETISTPKSLSNSQNRNRSFFSMCCSIH
ncbi:inositol polyphosphate-5-phosphatase A isoform X1 [Drosophila montana]|uniref:inositol polyphosphate-5-phosphatase A isoform X1 n=1 Tax=Drosophila montana TaxID=40370 RepID=UPI00313CCEEE